MSALIHAANILFLLSYLVRDILWLRCLTFVAGILLILYFGVRPEPQWEPVAWNVLFLVLNTWQIVRLLRERRPVHLDGDAARLHRLAFRALTPREFSRLLGVGAWRSVSRGDELVTEGKPLDRLLVLLDGRVAVEAAGERVAELGAGRLVGEISFLTSQPTSARVLALGPCRLLEWPSEALRKLMSDDPELRAALQLVIGTDLASKLKHE